MKRKLKIHPSKRCGPIIQRRMERSWVNLLPSAERISHAKSLESDGIFSLGVFENLAKRVKRMLDETLCKDLCVMTCAASLAHHGVLGSVHFLRLRSDVDLASIPGEHLASLASCVTWGVSIRNHRGCDLVSILDRVNCPVTIFSQQRLGSEEITALVRAMESRVTSVCLGDEEEEEEESSSITTGDDVDLTEYTGEGKCEVICQVGTAPRYREQMRTWAQSKNWVVDYDDEYGFSVCQDLNSEFRIPQLVPYL